MQSLSRAALVICLVGAGCSADSPSDPVAEAALPTGAPTVAVATSTSTPTVAPTTTAPTTTPPTTTATTTTTTVPPLDRASKQTGDRIAADVAALVAFGPRVEGTAAETEAAAWLADRLLDIIGSEPIDLETMPVELPNALESRNLWLTIGDRATGPWTLLGAHYDSITGSPGADDNASGTAILLELAARLVEQSPTRGAVTIMFFGAEEIYPGLSRDNHHFGSRQWVAAQTEGDLPLPDLMVSVDMVGVGDRLFAVAYSGTGTAAVDALVAAAADAGINIDRLERGDISDHEPFALQGIPAAMLWRPDNPAYHEAGDDAVNVAHVVAVLELVESLVADLHG